MQRKARDDVLLLKGFYTHEVKIGSVLGSDAAVTITENGTPELPAGTRVLINPGSGWESDERGPENSNYLILGLLPLVGALTEESINIDRQDLISCPEHLSKSEADSLPLAGLAAYR